MWGKHGDIALLNPQRAATQFLESAYQLTQYRTYYILLVCLFDCFCIGFLLLLLFCIFF